VHSLVKEVLNLAFFEDTDILETPFDIFMFDSTIDKVTYRAHWHNYVEFLYIYEGHITVECDNVPYSLNPGDSLVIMPRVIHSFYSKFTGHIRYGVIKFNHTKVKFSTKAATLIHAIFSRAMPMDSLPIYLSASDINQLFLKSTIDNIISEAKQKNLFYFDFINSQIATLMVTILRFWEKKDINLNTIIKQSNNCSEIFKVLEYISNHSCESIAIPSLAKQCNMSYSTFSRLFKQQTGRSCKEYIEYMRISKAQDLVLFTSKSLNCIACETGFSDCSHFIKTYKKLFGITPNQQRKSLPSDIMSSADIKT